MYLYTKKWEIENELYSERHPVRVQKREREEEERFANLPPMVPLSRCESPELRKGTSKRSDLPHTYRMFLRRLSQDPDVPGTAEEVIQDLIIDFRDCVPFSFDARDGSIDGGAFAPDRFTLEYSERDFILVNDHFHNRGYELPYSAIIWERWNPRAFLEREHAALTAWIEEFEADNAWLEEGMDSWLDDETDDQPDTEGSWTDCGLTCSDDGTHPRPPPPPPPPPPAATASDEVEFESDSELGEPPNLQAQPESDYDSESEADSMPELQHVSDSECDSESEMGENSELESELDFDSDSDLDWKCIPTDSHGASQDGYDTDNASSSDDSDDDADEKPTCSVQVSAVTPKKTRKNTDEGIEFQRNASRVRDFARLLRTASRLSGYGSYPYPPYVPDPSVLSRGGSPLPAYKSRPRPMT
ncbi:hypothetical protein DFH06DRAFT_1120684 [Mycena polygramma]|nr:hypothetical protein DFH06DRAFT_1120684 [Mycena polygramma]